MDQRQNTGGFMSANTGGTNGIGPQLRQLMQQSPNSGQGSPLQQNSTQMPPQAPLTQTLPRSMTNNMQFPVRQQNFQQGQQQMTQAVSQNPNAGLPVQQQGAPELQIALNALANYIKSHGSAHEANHNVPLKTATAKVIAAQAPQNPQGGA